jgi:hypothetical protein
VHRAAHRANRRGAQGSFWLVPMCTLTEVKGQADIRDVWAAPGGGKLRGNGTRAHWCGSGGFNVAPDPGKDIWHDLVTGEGGGVVPLVSVVRPYSSRDAMRRVVKFTGALEIPVDNITRFLTDLCR